MYYQLFRDGYKLNFRHGVERLKSSAYKQEKENSPSLLMEITKKITVDDSAYIDMLFNKKVKFRKFVCK